MFRSIVVPLDGSELAERALPYAVQLARAGDGALTRPNEAHRTEALTARASPLSSTGTSTG
jgi:nucleotide-binding universal stress UspA family protein